MAISTEAFDLRGESGVSLSTVPLTDPVAVCQLQCRCSYSPPGQQFLAPSRCQKCASGAFERVAVPGIALALACRGRSALQAPSRPHVHRSAG